ncbi:MAG: HlyD family efflux transporter periplasmic adaptor subunit [Pseudomonadota bacterium]
MSAGRAAALGGLLLAALLIWAALTEVEVVVSAPAAARPVGGIAELRAPARGRVARVSAGEGEAVEAGKPLIELEPGAERTRWRTALRGLEQRRRRLRDLRALANALEPGAMAQASPDLATTEIRVRLAAHRSRLRQLDAERVALESEHRAVLDRAATVRALLAIRDERYQAARRAYRREALSRLELLAARRDRLAEQAEFRGLQGRAAALAQRIEAHESRFTAERSRERRATAEAIETLQLEIAEREAAVAEAAERVEQGRIAAPVDGVLDRLDVARGDLVEPGAVVGTVVPQRGALVFEARVPPGQAAFLHRGQSCRVKLDALPFPRYGALSCTVELLGVDVVDDGDTAPHYPVRVRPEAEVLRADGEVVRLKPGATAWVDIIAGRRSVLSFVTEPLRRFAMESLRER